MEDEDKLLNQVLGGGDIGEIDNVVDSIFESRKTKHADDAVDYEDIDELADEDLPEEEAATNGGLGDDDDLFNDLMDEGKPHDFVDHNHADQQFDDIFGGDHHGNNHDNNDDLFNDLGHSTGFEVDDGINEMRDMFREDDETYKKRQLELEEIRQAKRMKLMKVVAKLEKKKLKRNLKYYYPNYSSDKPFNYHTFFLPKPRYYNYQIPPIAERDNVKPLIPTKLHLELSLDTKKIFRSKKRTAIVEDKQGIVDITKQDYEIIKKLSINGLNPVSTKEISFLNKDWSNNDKFTDFSKELILSTTDWNDDDIINAGDKHLDLKKVQDLIDHDFLDDGDDDDYIENIFNGQISENLLKLDMNDPNLIFVPKKKDNGSKAVIPTNEKLLNMKFNISNDKEYEILKENYVTKVRSQLSNLNIEHSIPALRLQSPYYKVKLTKEEARSFHRPKFLIRPGTLVSFSKLRIRKKKKDRNKTSQEIFAKTADLTAADTANIIGLEYSEEYPQILSNFGMGSKIINYYRKELEEDTSRPKAPIGETHVLGVQDRSPFWNFGEVAPGDFVPALYNNMIRAPIFKHNVRNTDFLFIRSQGAGNHQKNYLRSINFVFSVGNIFPAVEVPAPHSRKVTNASKNRLKMVVFRVMNNNGINRVAVKDFSRHFPDQNDMQNRQRLKEFMEYQRQGEDQGFWKIKGREYAPPEEEIRSMLTPEDSVLLDSMQHGQQVLDDTYALYGHEMKKDKEKEKEKKEKRKKEVEDDDEEKEKERDENKDKEKDENEEQEIKKEKTRKARDPDAEVDIDEELAPWNLTRNFLNAIQTKSMLLLNGEGDPTGNGLGFSLIRATQRNGFQPLFAPPKENAPKTNTAAYVQKLYDQEIKRIWYSQRSSLVDHGDNFDLQTIYDEYKPSNHFKYIKSKIKDDKLVDEHQVLKITRRVRDKNGILQRKVEIVNDPRIIKAYIRRRKQIEDEMLKNAEVGDILPTSDKELNKIRRKALEEKLANLEKKAKLNKLKKPAKDSILAAAAAGGGRIIDANTVVFPDGSYAIGGKGIGKGKSKTRRCKSCGAFGHIRTNKSCPLYAQTQGGTIPPVTGIPVSTSSTPTSGTPVVGLSTEPNGNAVSTTNSNSDIAPVSQAPTPTNTLL